MAKQPTRAQRTAARAKPKPGEPTHKCPIGICILEVRQRHLMCPTHWRMVPMDLNREVYRAYREGSLAEHVRACNAAIAAVEALIASVAHPAATKGGKQ